MQGYTRFLGSILDQGSDKLDRTGTGTQSQFDERLSHKMSDGFPLLTTKFVSVKNIITEWKWMMLGITDVKYLQDNNCTIWDEWADIQSCKRFERMVGDLGPVYGHQWRNFGATPFYSGSKAYLNFKADLDTFKRDNPDVNPNDIENPYDLRLRAVNRVSMHAQNTDDKMAKLDLFDHTYDGKPYYYGYKKNGFDQIAWLLKELKLNPNSRRLIVSGWNPKEANEVALPPCHTMWQLHVDSENNKLNLALHQRSADAFLGIPYNVAFYGFMIEFFSMMYERSAGSLHINAVDAHIYHNHEDAVETQLSREGYALPKIEFSDEFKGRAKSLFHSIQLGTNLNKLGVEFNELISEMTLGKDVFLLNYKHHPSIKADVAV